jgi:hypothetical protein
MSDQATGWQHAEEGHITQASSPGENENSSPIVRAAQEAGQEVVWTGNRDERRA